jgi:hypothetical protein
MDSPSLVLNVAALTISLVALSISATLTARQLSVMNRANALPVITSFFSEFQRSELLEHLDYVAKELHFEHSPDLGVSRLPEPARSHVSGLASFFEATGALVAWNVIDKRVAISSCGTQCDRAWRLLEPFILGEREARGGSRYQVYFEDLVCRIRETPPPVVERRMGLKQLPRAAKDPQMSDKEIAERWLKAGAKWHHATISGCRRSPGPGWEVRPA